MTLRPYIPAETEGQGWFSEAAFANADLKYRLHTMQFGRVRLDKTQRSHSAPQKSDVLLEWQVQERYKRPLPFRSGMCIRRCSRRISP